MLKSKVLLLPKRFHNHSLYLLLTSLDPRPRGVGFSTSRDAGPVSGGALLGRSGSVGSRDWGIVGDRCVAVVLGRMSLPLTRFGRLGSAVEGRLGS